MIHLLLSFETDAEDLVVSLTGRQTQVAVEKEDIRAEASENFPSRIQREHGTSYRKASKHLLAAPDLQGTPSAVPAITQLPPAYQPSPFPNRNVTFHFFLADEQHGAIPKPLESCENMDLFFDEALAAWGALREEQPQPPMIAVKVIIKDFTRPIVVLWRNLESFDSMMDTIHEQAAGKPTKLNVDVHCFSKRG